MSIFEFENMEKASHALARRICTSAQKTLAKGSRFTLVLSGGSTPRRLYHLLSEATYADHLDWRQIHLFWGDERCVAPDHPDSNFLMAKETFLDKIPIPAAHIHRMPGEMMPEDGARSYQQELELYFAGTAPVFDLILLGLGSDGHTASLFPGTSSLQENERLVIAVAAPLAMSPQVARLTLTLPAINRAKEICFLASGEKKHAIVRSITEGQGQEYPAGMVVNPDWYLADY